ncbi:MAG: sortase [Anaerolineae bacterium]|nr:sortase [Anaerolineae bacterium]
MKAIKQVGSVVGLILLLGLVICFGTISVNPTTIASAPPSPAPPAPASPIPATPVAGGLPTRIIIEKVNLDAPVVEMGWRVIEQAGRPVSEWVVPENEAGWHINSARPGQGSNVVLSGHNNSTGGHVFAGLTELAVGDTIRILTSEDEQFDYQIEDTQIVRTLGASQETLAYLQTAIEPTAAERLTLITCWPSWTNTHRLIIVASPIKVGLSAERGG